MIDSRDFHIMQAESIQYPCEEDKAIVCVGSVVGPVIPNETIADSLNFQSNSRAILQRDYQFTSVWSWPGAVVVQVAEPLSSALSGIIGPIGSISVELHSKISSMTLNDSHPTVWMNTSVLVTPSQRSKMMVFCLIFCQLFEVEAVVETFNYYQIRIQKVENYTEYGFNDIKQIDCSCFCQSDCAQLQITQHGCKTKLLKHQEKAVQFILDLESPQCTRMKKLWYHPANKWIVKYFDALVQQGRTPAEIQFYP